MKSWREKIFFPLPSVSILDDVVVFVINWKIDMSYVNVIYKYSTKIAQIRIEMIYILPVDKILFEMWIHYSCFFFGKTCGYFQKEKIFHLWFFENGGEWERIEGKEYLYERSDNNWETAHAIMLSSITHVVKRSSKSYSHFSRWNTNRCFWPIDNL